MLPDLKIVVFELLMSRMFLSWDEGCHVYISEISRQQVDKLSTGD
jgi:hypothetical protein